MKFETKRAQEVMIELCENADSLRSYMGRLSNEDSARLAAEIVKANIQAAGIALNLDMQLVAMEQAKRMGLLGEEAIRRAKEE